MACRGCAQSGDCACAVVGDGDTITVSGTGGALDPYVVSFNGENWLESIVSSSPDLCSEDWTVVAQRTSDGLVRRIPAQKRCAVVI